MHDPTIAAGFRVFLEPPDGFKVFLELLQSVENGPGIRYPLRDDQQMAGLVAMQEGGRLFRPQGIDQSGPP